MKEYRKLQMIAARAAGKACRALHLTSPAIPSYQLDLDGKPLYKSKSNSWTRNMINTMAVQGMMGAPGVHNASYFTDGYLNFRTTNGTISGSKDHTYTLCSCVRDAYNQWGVGSAYGILVGSSDVAESFDDYNLGATIGHGAGAGQLNRALQSIVSQVWNSSSRKWILTLLRGFVNTSGGDVTVKELGFLTATGVLISNTTSSNDSYIKLLIRDVLPAPVTVANGQTLTVTYTIEYSF